MAAIAFIGLGQMGSPMASNLLQQGHQLRVFDVNAEAVRHLVDKGATPTANPAQAAKDAEFIITMLPNGDLVRNVLFGENGVCEGLSRGLRANGTKTYVKEIIRCLYLNLELSVPLLKYPLAT